MKTFFFFTVILFVSGSIYDLNYSQELDSVPEFVELTTSPISKGFLSYISLHLNTNDHTNNPNGGGYAKVMFLVNDLIQNNRRQLQDIKRINHRVEGQCLVSTHNLSNRSRNFKSLLEYFKLKSTDALKEKTESINMRDNRKIHIQEYSNAQDSIKRSHQQDMKKWEDRLRTANDAIHRAGIAIKAVNEWSPNTSHSFIETAIKETIRGYSKVTQYPLNYDPTFVQLAANDNKIKKRLYEWLNMLKGNLVQNLSYTQRSSSEVSRYFGILNNDLNSLIKLLNQDVTRLNHIIVNIDNLLKSYSSNEQIYLRLSRQTNRVIEANTVWCRVEGENYRSNLNRMSEQLKVFNDIKQWFRTNFSRVKQWIAKKYN